VPGKQFNVHFTSVFYKAIKLVISFTQMQYILCKSQINCPSNLQRISKFDFTYMYVKYMYICTYAVSGHVIFQMDRSRGVIFITHVKRLLWSNMEINFSGPERTHWSSSSRRFVKK
jgi:hypothetical protein